ncbi:hypothetical protein Srubr_37110 [Streptomyces rubradiris]|uniref:Uncharacterized protein n=1 Tax=Streptomyces rubradiris TaxID=285531 RepID=A0ABQ3RDG9_STRRR|nr:hypothetical protein GCM10018792_06020 [Streptomyces rubradiris]GHI53865.1 hypothetical protein Srubr_37110 [Streptomyces rubradiris]
MTAEDVRQLREGLRRLTRYLAEKGFDAKTDARGREKEHLIVYRIPDKPESASTGTSPGPAAARQPDDAQAAGHPAGERRRA